MKQKPKDDLSFIIIYTTVVHEVLLFSGHVTSKLVINLFVDIYIDTCSLKYMFIWHCALNIIMKYEPQIFILFW